MYHKLYETNFDSISEGEDEKEKSLNPWKNDGDFINLVSKNKLTYELDHISVSSMLEIFKDRHEPDNEEVEEKEKKQNNNTLNEMKNHEKKDSPNKSTTKNTKKSIEIKLIEPSKDPENKLLCNKRRKPSLDSPNENNKDDPKREEDFKIKIESEKPKENNIKKNDSSPIPYIKKFHTLFNIYFKNLVEKESFDVSGFDKKDKKEGPNGYYINKDFTQLKLAAKVHSEKLNEKIAKFIQENKLKKLKEKNNEKVLKILDLTARELINNFYSYIFENSYYFKENVIIKEINDNFIRLQKYPLIGFENDKSEDYKFGYFKYFCF